MMNVVKAPLIRENDGERLGFIVNDGSSWLALTIFNHPILRTSTRTEAEKTLREQGLTYLTGVWQYYDKDDGDWFPCVIKEAFEQKVIVNRTNELGYEDPDDYKQVVIEDPSENTLIKST